MCITIDYSYKAPEDGVIRYKVVTKRKTENGERLVSPFYSGTVWQLGKTRKKRAWASRSVDEQGYHVFVTRKDARFYKNGVSTRKILKVRCSKFVAGGQWSSSNNPRSEIWKEITPISLVR